MQQVEVRAAPLQKLGALVTPEALQQLMATVERARELLTGRVVWNVNATARGGGVAELLQALLAYGRGADVDTRWLVLDGDPAFFTITKRIHNALHGWSAEAGFGSPEHEHYEQILHDNLVTVKNERKVTIEEGNESLTVTKGNRTIKVDKGDETHEVKGKRTLTVHKDEAHTSKANLDFKVTKNYTIKVDGDLVIEAKSVTIKAKQGVAMKAGTDFKAEAGTAMVATPDEGIAATESATNGSSSEVRVAQVTQDQSAYKTRTRGLRRR